MGSEQAVLVNEGVVLENWLVINDYREQLGLTYQDMNRVFGGLNALVKIFDKLELESRGDLQNGKPIEIGYSDELADALGLFLRGKKAAAWQVAQAERAVAQWRRAN